DELASAQARRGRRRLCAQLRVIFHLTPENRAIPRDDEHGESICGSVSNRDVARWRDDRHGLAFEGQLLQRYRWLSPARREHDDNRFARKVSERAMGAVGVGE